MTQPAINVSKGLSKKIHQKGKELCDIVIRSLERDQLLNLCENGYFVVEVGNDDLAVMEQLDMEDIRYMHYGKDGRLEFVDNEVKKSLEKYKTTTRPNEMYFFTLMFYNVSANGFNSSRNTNFVWQMGLFHNTLNASES